MEAKEVPTFYRGFLYVSCTNRLTILIMVVKKVDQRNLCLFPLNVETPSKYWVNNYIRADGVTWLLFHCSIILV